MGKVHFFLGEKHLNVDGKYKVKVKCGRTDTSKHDSEYDLNFTTDLSEVTCYNCLKYILNELRDNEYLLGV